MLAYVFRAAEFEFGSAAHLGDWDRTNQLTKGAQLCNVQVDIPWSI